MTTATSSEHKSPLLFENVQFAYGRSKVLQGLNLALRPGEVTVLAAPNGTGKTTALWLAAGLLKPMSGKVSVLSQDPFHQRQVLGRVGFVAEGGALPGTWTGKAVLDFQRGTFPHWDEVECRRLLERFALDPSRQVRTLSRGERGKLALTAVLCTRPELLLLDEPSLGFDLASRKQFASELLGRLAETGCSVLMSSHEIAEVERSGDRFVLLRQGQVACDEAISSLLERHRVLSWDERKPGPPAGLDLLPLPSRLGPRALARRWDEHEAAAWLASGGEVNLADLETIYLSLTGEVEHA